MQQMPEWWLTSSGIFFILGAVAMGLIAISSMGLLWILLDLRKGLLQLNAKANALTDKVDTIATNVKDVTDEIGTRARGITKVVDEHAHTAFSVIEKVAPVFIAIGLISKIAKLVKRVS
ncbi:MAG: hypothetical protein KF824_04800 [Fimbriimonadaceae bacterium]|nr:MAG: hypothetical protein KF824_04800 [Fimbriimonadaceae bacterium]